MFSAREMPWHGLGTVTDDELTAQAALEAAGLDWLVQPKPVYVKQDDGSIQEISNYRAFARSTDGRVLHVASPLFTPIDNYQMFEFAETLLDVGQLRYTTAGSLREGGVVFATVELPKEITVAGDTHKTFLVISNAHNGTMAFKAIATPVRVVVYEHAPARDQRGEGVVVGSAHAGSDRTYRRGTADA